MGITDLQFRSGGPTDLAYNKPDAEGPVIAAAVDTGVINCGSPPAVGVFKYWDTRSDEELGREIT